MLTDTPRKANWLNDREKDVVEAVLAADDADATHSHANFAAQLGQIFRDGGMWILAFVYFTGACANYAFSLFVFPLCVRCAGDLGDRLEFGQAARATLACRRLVHHRRNRVDAFYFARVLVDIEPRDLVCGRLLSVWRHDTVLGYPFDLL